MQVIMAEPLLSPIPHPNLEEKNQAPQVEIERLRKILLRTVRLLLPCIPINISSICLSVVLHHPNTDRNESNIELHFSKSGFRWGR
jgi:hypothetical protein